jgi:hypothetical protein
MPEDENFTADKILVWPAMDALSRWTQRRSTVITTPWVLVAMTGLSAAATGWCVRTIRKSHPSRGRRVVPLCRCLLYYLIPFIVALVVLLTLYAYLRLSPGSLSYGELTVWQQRVDHVYEIFNAVRVPEWMILLIFLAVFAGNSAMLIRKGELPRSRASRLPYPLARKYHNMVASVSILLGVLVAFTFLGTQLGEPRQDMELRLRTIEQGYAKLVDQTQKLLEDRTPIVVADNAVKALPPEYIQGLRPSAGSVNLPSQINHRTADLERYYRSVRGKYPIRDQGVERLLAKEKVRLTLVARLPGDIDRIVARRPRNTGTEPLGPTFAPPKSASKDSIAAASRSLGAVRPKGKYRLMWESSVDVRVQFGVTLRELASELARPLARVIPLGDPLMETLSGLVDESIEIHIRAASHDAAQKILADAAHSDAIVDVSSELLASEVDVRGAADRYSAAARHSLDQATDSFKALGAAHRRLEMRVTGIERALTDSLIGQLAGGSEGVADKVSARIATRGAVITKAQVKRLVNIMRSGTRSWSGPPYRSWPGSHCTCTAHTSIRLYAAQAVSELDSPYVSESLRQEALEAQSNAVTYTKRTDPGWVCTVDGSSSADALCRYQQNSFAPGRLVTEPILLGHRLAACATSA